MKTRVLLFVTLIVAGFVFITSRGNPAFDRLLAPIRGQTRWPGAVRTRPQTAGLSPDELNNIDIYKKARLATVHITSTVYRRGWFMEVIPSRDIGSGFVLDDSGHILTNNHVLQGGGKIQVTMENQDTYDATGPGAGSPERSRADSDPAEEEA